MKTLDAFVADVGVKPDFVKIDVEGFEYSVLTGASSLLRDKRPMLMIEIRDSNRDRCFRQLRELGYVLISPELRLLDSANRIQMNTFCLHSEEHRDQLAILGYQPSPTSGSSAALQSPHESDERALEPLASPSTAPRRSACERHVPAGLGVPHHPGDCSLQVRSHRPRDPKRPAESGFRFSDGKRSVHAATRSSIRSTAKWTTVCSERRLTHLRSPTSASGCATLPC